MTTNRFLNLEIAHHLADRLRSTRLQGRGWNQIADRDFQRETHELQVMAQSAPYRAG